MSQKAGAYVDANTVDQGLLSGYRPVLLRDRMKFPGGDPQFAGRRSRLVGSGEGAEGENPPATRLNMTAHLMAKSAYDASV
jgi:hypothetical protein